MAKTNTEPVKQLSKLEDQARELRSKMLDHMRHNRSGSATNFKAAKNTRKQLARVLTEINQMRRQSIAADDKGVENG